MPQMSPLLWVILFIVFAATLLSYYSVNFACMTASKESDIKPRTQHTKTWLW